VVVLGRRAGARLFGRSTGVGDIAVVAWLRAAVVAIVFMVAIVMLVVLSVMIILIVVVVVLAVVASMLVLASPAVAFSPVVLVMFRFGSPVVGGCRRDRRPQEEDGEAEETANHRVHGGPPSSRPRELLIRGELAADDDTRC
jgi:hypothetical protein